MDLVSIITPVYNSADFIKETILSVTNQTYPNWELIIVDDCSTDNTEFVISELIKAEKRIKYIRQKKNGGAGIARNKGIELAQGKYIAFLDSDDQWLEDKLHLQICYMEKQNCNFSFTDYYIVKGSEPKKLFKNYKTKISYKDEEKFNYIACSTVIYNQNMLGKIYMPTIRNRQDWGLWLNILQKTKFAYCYTVPLTYYHIRENSISNNKIKMIKYHWYIYRYHLKKELLMSLFYLFNNLILHLIYSNKKKLL